MRDLEETRILYAYPGLFPGSVSEACRAAPKAYMKMTPGSV